MGRAKRVRKEKRLRRRCKHLQRMLTVASHITTDYMQRYNDLREDVLSAAPGDRVCCQGCSIAAEFRRQTEPNILGVTVSGKSE